MTQTPVPSVLLLSGGLDSAANLALALERDEVVLALTMDYGQRAAASEIRSSRAFCDYYDVRHEVVDLRWLGALGGSALTDTTHAVPALEASQLDNLDVTSQSARSVWVPNRNGVFINVAAAWAERLGARRVLVGFNREEAVTFPDNSRAFQNAASSALQFSTANGVEVFSYTVELDKREIVSQLRGLTKAFPFQHVWSCYQAGEVPCGKCESCNRFRRAHSRGVEASP